MNNFNVWLRAIEEAVRVLKIRFPNLTAEEVVKIANSVVATIRLELEK